LADVEIIARVERRRKWTAPEKAALLAEVRHHVATATTLDGLCDLDHVPYMFYLSRRL
jgi:hypothetical protein